VNACRAGLGLFMLVGLLPSIGQSSRAFDSDSQNADIKTARVLYQQRKYQQAIGILKNVVHDNSSNLEAAQLLALSYYSTGQLEQSIPLLERLQSEAGAAGFDTAHLLGLCYLRMRQADKARAAFARMYSVEPGSGVAHLIFARMLVHEHREDEAIPEVKAALALQPRLGMAHFLLGEIYLYKGEIEPAISEFRKEIEISPALWLVYWRLGDALARLNAYDDAERAVKQALSLNESFSGAYVTLGEIAQRRGDLELAAGLLERAVKMEPANQNAHYALAKTYQRLGRQSDANRQFELSRSLLAQKNVTEPAADPHTAP
jgi:tetratricopeptide (TPR) repeat protein